MDLGLVARLERHAFAAWPASEVVEAPGAWRYRVTPAVQRSRSNAALPPCAPVEDPVAAVDRVERFYRARGRRPQIQLSPRALHGALEAELDRRNWTSRYPCAVLTAPAASILSSSAPAGEPAVTVEHEPSAAWLATWAEAEGRDDAGAHADAIFSQLTGRAAYLRAGELGSALAVWGEGLCGIFCMATRPAARRRGIATALLARAASLAAAHAGPLLYLQVDESNAPALALYHGCGFTPAYRYIHRQYS